MKVLIALTLVAAAVGVYYMTHTQPMPSQFSEDHTIEQKFMYWMSEHEKSYETVMEYKMRLANFAKALVMIKRQVATNASYKLGLTSISDLTEEEFNSMPGYTSPIVNKVPTIVGEAEVANSVDWVAAGAVTGVKNQGSCGSCYSFSATGAIEGAHFLHTGELLNLADKDCLDCSFRIGNKRSQRGHMSSCFEYFEKSHELCLEADYPYKAKYETCKEKKCAHTVHNPVTDYDVVKPKTLSALLEAIQDGPVAMAVAVSQEFQHYKEGVFSNVNCTTRLNHGVLAVGYEIFEKDEDQDKTTGYVTIKNSWGAKWGEAGYIKVAFGECSKGGMCGIFMDNALPHGE